MGDQIIRISYDPERHYCRIESDSSNWNQIKILISELSTDNLSSSDTVEIPWHSFIANLKEVNYIASRYHIKVDISPEALKLIQSSIENRKSFLGVEKIELTNDSDIDELLKKIKFIRELKSYQKRNVAKLLRLDSGATFSVPGAGKTSEAIAYYLIKRQSQKLLVICPKAAFPAWEEQFVDCLGESKIKIQRLTGGLENIKYLLHNDSTVYLISYQQFIRVVDTISKFLHENHTFVFLDESHRIKGGDYSETGRQIQLISHLPYSKLIMSGTPMPNSVSDLIPQFKFLFPEIDIDERSIVEKIQTIYVRTTKEELGLTKPKIFLKTIPFTEPQKYLYDLSRSEEYRKAQNLNRTDKFFLRSLGKSYMRLLQIVSNPALLIRNNFGFPDALREAVEFGDSGKIDYAINRSRQLAKQGHKTIIWSGFVENVELISRKLSDLGADYLHGGVEAGSEDEENTREQKVKRFHDDRNAMVLVANPAACSEGISLHKVCHYAIYVDRNYNAAQFLQSMDRIHRLGLEPGIDTTIEILHTPGSIDENIENRVDFKIKRMAEILNDKSLHVEAETIDLDETGFNMIDAEDLLFHLKGE